MEQARHRQVDILPALLGSATTLILFLCVAAGLMKLFQIAGDLRELKDVLQDIKRNTQDLGLARPASAPSEPLSPEALVRAVHAQSDLDSLTLDSTVLPPQS
jgi:hypothetical protein